MVRPTASGVMVYVPKLSVPLVDSIIEPLKALWSPVKKREQSYLMDRL